MKRDVAGGAAIAIIIVMAFLSLMSFIEFMRFGGDAEAGEGIRVQQRRNNARGANAPAGDVPIEGEIDDIIPPHQELDDSMEQDDTGAMSLFAAADELDRAMLGDLRRFNESINETVEEKDHSLPERQDVAIEVPAANNKNMNHGPNDWRIRHGLEPMDENDHNAVIQHINRAANPEGEQREVQGDQGNNEDDDFEEFLRAQEEQDDLEQQMEDDDEAPLPGIEFRQNRRPRDDARFEPQFEPLQPAFRGDQDDPDDGMDMDMEINLALDELLGLRGPILAVVRNLLWLLVFNTAYLGIFALLPASFGDAIYKLSTKLAFVQRTLIVLPGFVTLSNTLVALNEKSKETKLIFQPSDIGQICLGYIFFSCSVFFIQMVANATVRKGAETSNLPDEDNARKMLLSIIDCCAGVVKIAGLLFIKMILLPLTQGLCLDIVTLPLFNVTLDERIDFAGGDLFSSMILHWFVGITFMLLITLFILQIREVAHPDILARLIRPQDPQPDLIASLLQETAFTHTKRILQSLGLYLILLAFHIWIPSRLLLANGIYKLLPFFKPRYWHIMMPHIQIPFELCVFHVCMLSVLEKYKNNIGGLQHHWLRIFGGFLGFTNEILPREVDKFKHVGTLSVYRNEKSPTTERLTPSDTTDPFWRELISEQDSLKRESLIRSRLAGINHKTSHEEEGQVRRDGKKALSNKTYIKFPAPDSDKHRVIKTPHDGCLLPACIGRYRFKQGEKRTAIPISSDTNYMPKVMVTPVIEIYEEIPGKLIPRPPEGWDDLLGGTQQGRWAYGNEQISEIEASVAARTPFLDESSYRFVSRLKFVAKMVFFFLVTWVVITFLLMTGLNLPLFIGHCIFHLLLVPERCFHDPLAFVLGVIFLIPIVGTIAKTATSESAGLLNWMKSFKPNESRSKTTILLSFFVQWFVICPFLLGFLYSSFFVGFASVVNCNIRGWMANWGTGTLLLNTWAVMCYFKVFSMRFWIDLIRRVWEAPDDAGRNEGGARQQPANDVARNNPRRDNFSENDGANPSWQGKEGAIGHCFTAFTTFLVGWEWDKLDHDAMLRDCVTPIFQQLLIACIAPTVLTVLASFFYHSTIARTAKNLLISSIDNSSVSVLFRVIAVSTSTIQLLRKSKAGLKKWFEAVHKIARDDRYLIGEILLNYSPPSSTTTVS
eukprot:scaffold91580_cov70-Cyclotella_meneghiniana.AAC.7